MDTHTRNELKRLHAELLLRQKSANARLNKRRGLIRPLSEGLIQFNNPQGLTAASGALQERMGMHKPFYLLDPEGLFCRIWNCCAVVIIFLLVFYLPILIAYFNEPEQCDYCTISGGNREGPSYHPGNSYEKGWRIFPVMTNYFFMVDIIVQMLTGMTEADGARNYSLRAIWRRYIRVWFWVDAISCIPLECILFTAAPSVYWYNLPNLIRLLRVVGIRRRAQGSPFRWIDKISDVRQEFSFGARRLSVAAIAIAIAVHWYACTLWWTIRLEGFPPNHLFATAVTWPAQLGLVDDVLPVQYLFSVFSVVSAMIGLGYGSYPPVTWGEALVWVFCMITVAVMFAVMNGFIIALILSSSSSRHQYKLKMDTIMETTDDKDLPEDLRHKIIQFFKYKYREGRIRNQGEILKELPYDMQTDVAMHATGTLLEKVPIIADEPTLMRRVALELHPAYALEGQQIVQQGWPSNHMYFIRSGLINLVMTTHDDKGSAVDTMIVDTLRDGNFFGEDSLLTLPPSDELLKMCGAAAEQVSNYKELFSSVMTAEAFTNCDLYVLDADRFHELAEDYPRVKAKLHAWALRHAKRLLKYGIGLGPRALTKLHSINEDSWEGRKIGSPVVVRDMQQLRRSMHAPLRRSSDSSDDDDPDATSHGGPSTRGFGSSTGSSLKAAAAELDAHQYVHRSSAVKGTLIRKDQRPSLQDIFADQPDVQLEMPPDSAQAAGRLPQSAPSASSGRERLAEEEAAVQDAEHHVRRLRDLEQQVAANKQ